jgi:hypothetical protein
MSWEVKSLEKTGAAGLDGERELLAAGEEQGVSALQNVGPGLGINLAEEPPCQDHDGT